MLLMLGCNSEPKSNIILVEISPDKLLLENRQVKIRDFESELKAVVRGKLKEGFKNDELTVNLKVDDKTTRGDVVDLESCMRRVSLRKVMYSSVGDEPQRLFRLE
jgi:hypothetical protein